MSNNLTHELLKNCTSLVKLSHLNDLCSNLNNKTCNVYGLRAEFGYPEHLIPPNNKNYIAYMGVSKKKSKQVMDRRILQRFLMNQK